MRQLPALLLLLSLPMLSAGQSACTPFDNNGDNVVGIGDLIDLLARFGDSDLDVDGMWDSVDDCVGAYDTCGVCNGPGPQVLAIDTIIITLDSIYVEAIDEWLTYELSRDTLLHLVCENPGCTDPLANNFDPYAEEGGFCSYLSCFGPTFDGYTYEAVEIGDQCWFAEDLRTTVYANGDSISSGLAVGEWTSSLVGASSVYGEGSSVCWSYSPNIDACDEAQSLAEYGRLYNWYAVDDARGLCPSGWHVPSDEEWTDLEDHLWTIGFPALLLKSTVGWYDNGNGTDDFGFAALPSGHRNIEAEFDYAGSAGYWWSSSGFDSGAWYRKMDDFHLFLYRSAGNSRDGHSVRCLRDAE